MENISKIVVVREDARVLGYVLNIVLDNLVKTGYVVVDEETEGEYLLRNEDIVSVSSSHIVIDSVSNLEFLTNSNESILGFDVVDENGISFGNVCDIKFSKNKCEKIITKNCEILAKFIKKIGKNCIFLNFNKKNKQKYNSKQINKNDNILVKIQNVAFPEKVSLSNSFYIGKVCLKDIVGYNNERIVSAGEVVSKAIVEKARRHDKLNQLYFALKRE